jgi:hypothetical protein
MRTYPHGLHARQELTTLEKQKAAYLINGDADPNASSRACLSFPEG